MSKEIARTQDHLNEMMNWSRAMSQGNLMPRQYQGNPANLMFAAEYADALGISRIHVLTSIAVINGRPSPSADLMSAMVRQHGHKLRVTGDDTYAEAVLIRSDDPDFEYTARWDEAKARKAGLWGNKGPWSLYPGAMLRARAISEVVRMGASDVMAGGIYTPEEVGAVVDESGQVVEQPTQYQATRQAPAQQQDNSAQARLADALGAAPANTDGADVWADRIAEANSEDDLMKLYATASTNPEWESAIKAMFTARKQQILLDAQYADEAEALDAELVEDTTEESAA
jgi:hypothetical protein